LFFARDLVAATLRDHFGHVSIGYLGNQLGRANIFDQARKVPRGVVVTGVILADLFPIASRDVIDLH
jgi:hypothetical protein